MSVSLDGFIAGANDEVDGFRVVLERRRRDPDRLAGSVAVRANVCRIRSVTPSTRTDRRVSSPRAGVEPGRATAGHHGLRRRRPWPRVPRRDQRHRRRVTPPRGGAAPRTGARCGHRYVRDPTPQHQDAQPMEPRVADRPCVLRSASGAMRARPGLIGLRRAVRGAPAVP